MSLGQTSFTRAPYNAPTDANGIWLNDIPNGNPYHTFAVYDVNANNWC